MAEEMTTDEDGIGNFNVPADSADRVFDVLTRPVKNEPGHRPDGRYPVRAVTADPSGRSKQHVATVPSGKPHGHPFAIVAGRIDPLP
jgi:hypothetical protein